MIGFTGEFAWLNNLIAFIVIFAITWVASYFICRLLRHVLKREESPLPSSSIFVNIARVAIWCLGASFILDTCFGVNASALIAALGIGGIAVSLGFQDTLANLIGGLQLSIGKLVEPGEFIEVAGKSGKVIDVTWRHASLLDANDNIILIPNSVINKNTLVRLSSIQDIDIPFVLPRKADIAVFTQAVQEKTTAVFETLSLPDASCDVRFTGSDDVAITGIVQAHIKRGSAGAAGVRDSIARAIADELNQNNYQ